jgi:ribonucleoside-diphosphate reductase alpha chain
MQIAADLAIRSSTGGARAPDSAILSEASAELSQYRVNRRNGAVVGFEPGKISVAMTKAFIAVNGGQGAASARVRELVASLTNGVVAALARRQPGSGTFHIEEVQDQVELALMRSGEHEVARVYVLYREKRAVERALESARKKERNFFETRVTEYQTGGALSWD